jgi:DNA invertase Pin-like site-specific DNA recombinase
MKKLVPYYRVSTQKQGRSGLGLEAQQAAVEAYARSEGAEIAGKPFVEIETGKREDRPELEKAIAHAKRCKATLVVAKLDRLARNVAFTSALMRSGVDFVACDNPHANKLTIHILAAVAEDEAERISQRTKAALAAYKARGGLLGGSLPECRNLDTEAMAKGQRMAAEARSKKANEAYTDLYPLLTELRSAGKSLREIAAHLNELGYTTRRSKPWNPMQVKNVLERADSAVG